jgi:hypothetical protein
MAYNELLADRVREYLVERTNEKISEKSMFGGLAFLVNEKMCINISSDMLMFRFDPHRRKELLERSGVEPMIMRGKSLEGYCLVNPEGFSNKGDFEFWMEVCLDYNPIAAISKKATKKKTKK